MSRVALDLIEEPDARGVLVSSRGDVIALQLVEGKLTGDFESKLYVEKRGGYTILRREEWPPARPGAAGRTVITLRAWPNRS
jgi:hypothetical protein